MSQRADASTWADDFAFTHGSPMPGLWSGEIIEFRGERAIAWTLNVPRPEPGTVAYDALICDNGMGS